MPIYLHDYDPQPRTNLRHSAKPTDNNVREQQQAVDGSDRTGR